MSKTIEELKAEFKSVTEKLHSATSDLNKVSEQVTIERDIYMFLAEAATDGYWDWHIEDDYEYMSPRFWEIFGYLPEEKEHKVSAWQGMIHPDDLIVATENMNKHFETMGKHPYDQNVRYTHKLGHTVWVRCRGQVVKWAEDGRPLRMVGTHTDITHLKQTVNDLKEDVSHLEEDVCALKDGYCEFRDDCDSYKAKLAFKNKGQ